MMLVDVWPGGTLTNGAIGAYKEADENKVINIDEVVWYRSSNTAMISYRTDLKENEVHNLLRDLTAKHASDELHERLKVINKVIDGIEKEQTVDAVERKKGKWIFEPKDAIELMFTKPKCSKCGYESADGGNFCSNCGADMRGEANE